MPFGSRHHAGTICRLGASPEGKVTFARKACGPGSALRLPLESAVGAFLGVLLLRSRGIAVAIEMEKVSSTVLAE